MLCNIWVVADIKNKLQIISDQKDVNKWPHCRIYLNLKRPNNSSKERFRSGLNSQMNITMSNYKDIKHENSSKRDCSRDGTKFSSLLHLPTGHL